MKKLTKIFAIALLAQMCYVTMSFGATNLQDQQPDFDQVSRSFAHKVLEEYAKCDYNLEIYNRAFDEWLNFAERFDELTPTDVEATIKRFEAYRSEFKNPTEIALSKSEVLAFRGQGINASELLNHNIEYQAFYEQMCYQIEVLITYAQQPSVKMLVEGSILNHQVEMLSLEFSYYNMLHTFSLLSDATYDKALSDSLANLHFQYEVDIKLPSSEYRRMSDATLEKIERIASQLFEQTNKMGRDVMVASELEERFNSACQALDVAAEPLMSLDSVLLTPEDTKESARAKIEHAIAVVDNFEACAQEYIEAFGALCEALGVDTTKAEEERSTLANIVGDYNKGIESMKQTYESLGFGKFE